MIDYPDRYDCFVRSKKGDLYECALIKGDIDQQDGFTVYELRLASGKAIPESIGELAYIWVAVLPQKAKFTFPQ